MTGITTTGINNDFLVWFSPDERFLLTVNDGVGRLWDLESSEQVGDAFANDTTFQLTGAAYGHPLKLVTADADRIQGGPSNRIRGPDWPAGPSAGA